MAVFISGLPRSIEENVTTSKPQTLEEATNIAHRLMNKIIKHDFVQETNDHKRKLKDKGNIINNNNYQNNYNNNNHNNDYHQQQNKKQETFRTYAAANGYTGNRPLCEKCTLHHIERKDIMRMSARKKMTNSQESILRDKLAFGHFMISTLETTLEDIQIHQNLLQSENPNHQATILFVCCFYLESYLETRSISVNSFKSFICKVIHEIIK
ncbi:hypothetical protein Tco_0869711 [Tanacetum coccineum]